jgi:hypothetical protein
MFDRALSDPRVDGTSQTVFFRREESFKFVVMQGAEAAGGAALPPALRSDALLLADVVRRFGQAQIGAEAISTARRQDAFVFSGAPRSIRRGRTTEVVADLLGFFNAHVGGTADRHAAVAIDYAGGNTAWADGVQNPATTVEAQLDKIIADLAGEGGAVKIGAAATAGAPRALGAGSVKAQLDALLGFINGHITVAAGAHAASAVAYAAGGAWKDGTANPATTVKAQLDKLVADLSADAGGARVGAGARPNWIDGRTNPGGVSILAALSKIVADLSEGTVDADGAARIGARESGTLPAGSVRSQLDALNASAVRTNAPNEFSARQTLNGVAGDTNAALATTATPTIRKLLWEIAGPPGAHKYRLYAAAQAFEVTLNAAWNGARWVKDVALPSTKLELASTELRLRSDDAQTSPFDDVWPSSVVLEFSRHGQQKLDAGGNWSSLGPTESYAAWQGVSGSFIGRVGTGASFRKAFPATPSSITFVPLELVNISAGPVAHLPTPHGTGVRADVAQGNADTHLYVRVLAT